MLTGARPAVTTAEREVLGLVAGGLKTGAIATRLHVSSSTVSYHLGNLLSKFQSENRTQLTAKAYVLGYLRADAWPPETT